MSERISVEGSTGNVFADLGFPDAEQELAKALLSREIHKIIEERGLTQTAAAEILGISQPEVSKVVRGATGGFSLERLTKLLNALGQDVEIRVHPTPPTEDRGHLRIAVR